MNSLSSAHSLIRSLNGFRDENTIRLQSESFLRLLFLILLAPFVWSILGYLLFTATGPIGLGFYIYSALSCWTFTTLLKGAFNHLRL